MVKRLISFTFTIFILLFCCFFVSSQDISYTYEEPIEGLQLLSSLANTDGTMMVWMVSEDPEQDSCILPEFHLRLIDKTGHVRYIDFNYTFPAEAICPINMAFIPMTNNYLLVTYTKSNNDINKKYGLIVNYNSEIIR